MKKYTIHTTLDPKAYNLLLKYEKDLGTKNAVIEKALANFDTYIHKTSFEPGYSKRDKTRIQTGVHGLDSLLSGGIPRGFIVIVTGPPGTGKTTLSMQFLVKGIHNQQKGVLFTMEEKEDIMTNFSQYKWDIDMSKINDELEVMDISFLKPDEILDILKKYRPERIVFDSINTFFQDNAENIRKSPYWREIIKFIKNNSITTIMITEKNHGLDKKTFDDFDFLGDGIIFMDKILAKDITTYTTYMMSIEKMRSTNLDGMWRPFKFSNMGIELHEKDLVYMDIFKN